MEEHWKKSKVFNKEESFRFLKFLKINFFRFRFPGNDDDYMSVGSRKVCTFVKTDCIGASKGLFLGLLTLISGLICLILFFLLSNRQKGHEKVFKNHSDIFGMPFDIF